ncbi:MAG: hypothetical protein EOP24_39925 [Hyphomicrobiales bacterium]|nr:MAG: hypothetical protein EOP24_39925 [Hyphomicrobiales bacterium]
MKASLLASDGERYVAPVLDHARVVRINPDGILITGMEVIPRGAGMKNIKADYYPQTWWCIPVPSQPLPHADDLSEWRSAASKEWAERVTGLAQARQSDLTCPSGTAEAPGVSNLCHSDKK